MHTVAIGIAILLVVVVLFALVHHRRHGGHGGHHCPRHPNGGCNCRKQGADYTSVTERGSAESAPRPADIPDSVVIVTGQHYTPQNPHIGKTHGVLGREVNPSTAHYSVMNTRHPVAYQGSRLVTDADFPLEAVKLT